MNKFILIYMGIWTVILAVGVYLIVNQKPAPVIEKNVIEVEMDSSCYQQFLNNSDKTIFVKLYFEK